MNYQAVKSTFDGRDIYILTDAEAGLEATILPSFGCNFIGLAWTGKNGDKVQLMRTPGSLADLEASPNRYGYPVLMPPNRISGGEFEFQGKTYTFPKNEPGGKNHIHGLVNRLPWRVVKAEADEAGARLTASIRSLDHESITDSMPHDFELTLEFTVSGGKVTIKSGAVNNGADDMPFGIGFHPYFMVPVGGAGSKKDCFIKVPADDRWELVECIPTGRRLPVEGKYDLRRWSSLEGLFLDDVFTGLPLDNGHYACGYEDRNSGIGICLRTGPEFPQWVIFTGKTADSDFVCLEPYTCVTNAFNLDLPREETGMRVLSGGGKFSGVMEVIPYRI